MRRKRSDNFVNSKDGMIEEMKIHYKRYRGNESVLCGKPFTDFTHLIERVTCDYCLIKLAKLREELKKT